MQFSDSGRERVMRRTCGVGKEMVVNEVGGGGVVRDRGGLAG